MKNQQYIQTHFPVNLKKEHEFIYKKREYYKAPKLKVKEISNSFLTHYGILLKNCLLVKNTLPNLYGFKKPNSGFLFDFYKKAIEIYLVCKFGKSLEAKTLSPDKKYLFVYSPWFGYFSWITESLPRILSVREELENLTLILPESYSKKKFVINSLEMFPELKYEVIPDGIHMKVPKIIVPELKPYTYVFNPKAMVTYRDFVWKHLESLEINLPKYDKIFVSRKKAKNRKIVNESEVLNLFSNYNFNEVILEDYTFLEQVYLMKNCNVLAGIHGAGFANICFMQQGTKLLELIKEYSSYKEERPSYWRLSSALNIDYYVQFCKPKKYGNYDLWVGVDLVVDTKELEKNLKLVSK